MTLATARTVTKNRSVTYKRAGVNVDDGNRFVQVIKPLVDGTAIPGVVGRLGGFAGYFDPAVFKLKHPLLVASTDGVGTKLALAEITGRHDTIGVDLVAMCVNDIVTCGAQPIFFLDYFACGKLDIRCGAAVVRGIVRGCREAGCALIGGETAEMPGFYPVGRYDLAGFAVGVIERDQLITGRSITAGDIVIGLGSSGPHSNGYSLIRRVFSRRELAGSFGRRCLRPTVIYVKSIRRLCTAVPVRGLAHITGGGFYDNIPRIMPKGLGVQVTLGTWPIPPLFLRIQQAASISDHEMFRTFNMGIGMIVVVRPSDVALSQQILRSQRLRHWVIGRVVPGDGVTITKDAPRA